MGNPPKGRPGSDRKARVERATAEVAAAQGNVGAIVNRRAADRLRGGHLWVYASDIESISLSEGAPPALLPVADHRGLLLGTALYSPTSQIALCAWSHARPSINAGMACGFSMRVCALR